MTTRDRNMYRCTYNDEFKDRIAQDVSFYRT